MCARENSFKMYGRVWLKNQEFFQYIWWPARFWCFSTNKRLSFCGKIILREFLNGKGIIIQRYRFRDSMHHVSEVGIQSRKKGRLKRRVYNVKGANHFWHMDTNHKLVKKYLIIFREIDPYSRLHVLLECISNNKAPTVLVCFFKGCPYIWSYQQSNVI